MSRSLKILSVSVFAALLATSPAYAQVERTIYASVLDRTGSPVPALTATDFVVREDGVMREVVRATRATEPLQIAVLVDTSQAIERYTADLRKGLRAFFDAMAGKHEIALIGFGERPTVLADYTTDRAELEEGVGRLFPRRGSGSYVLDAIVETSRNLNRREDVRSVIVVITAEGPEFSNRYHEQVLDQLGTRATLHAFVLSRRGGPRLSDAAHQRELTLAKGSTQTGGRREHLLTSMALADRLHNLAIELQNQYKVEYVRPAALIAPESVEVDVKRPGLRVRAPRVPAAARTTY